MSGKAKFIFGTYIAAALVVLSLCCAIGYSRLREYRQAAAYSSRASFETTVKAVDSMGAALEKSLYATDGGMCSSLCGQVYASASAAEAALLSLPFETVELENLASFLNLAGDYAYSLAPQAAENGFSREEQEQLSALSQQAGDFAALLRQLQMDLNNGLALLDSREEQLQNVGLPEGGKISASLLEYEGAFDGSAFEYDGKYSLKAETEAGDLSEEQAMELAARVAGVDVRELKEEYSYSGTDGRRCYSAGDMLICVSSRGLESIGQSRLVSSGRLSTEKARQKAEEFLSTLELEELALISYSDSGTIASFNFAQVQDGALRLNSGVKVSVALDDGSIYAYNGENYSYEAAELNWATDEEEAAAQLPENVSSEGVRRVTIRSAGDRELPCYEFSCLNGEGESLKIYVNAQTGKQCRIDI